MYVFFFLKLIAFYSLKYYSTLEKTYKQQKHILVTHFCSLIQHDNEYIIY